MERSREYALDPYFPKGDNMIIKSKRIYFEDGCRDGYLVIEGSRIVGFLDSSARVKEYVDYSDYRIIPGIFDTHNHGTHGYTPNGLVDGIEEVKKYLKGLAANGVANVFPTMSYLEGTDNYKRITELYGKPVDGATILGIHSEDTNRLGHRVGEKGIPIGEFPIDMQLVRDTWEHSNGLLKLCGIAPEKENAQEAVDYLNSKGVKVAFMHSDADYAQAKEAFDKGGFYTSTHTCNVMRGIHHRNMGGLGACLLDDNLYNEIICDFLHVSPEMLQIVFRVKNNMDKWLMISDNVVVAGAPVGQYTSDSNYTRVLTEEGFCLELTGRLSGSTKPVLYGIGNLVEKLHMPIETVIRMASLNPCVAYGFDKTKGSIKLGKDADLAVITDDYKCVATYANGRKVYDRDVDTAILSPDYVAKYRISD